MGWDEPDMTEDEELLQGIVVEDVSGEYREVLHEVGFEDVELTELREIPKHATLFLMKELDMETGEQLQQAILNKEGPRYWNVRTELGNFAIYFAGKPLLDLANCHLYAYQIDPDFNGSDSRLCTFTFEHAHRLYRALKRNGE